MSTSSRTMSGGGGGEGNLQRTGSAVSSKTSDTLMEEQLNDLMNEPLNQLTDDNVDEDNRGSNKGKDGGGEEEEEEENVAVMVRCRPPKVAINSKNNGVNKVNRNKTNVKLAVDVDEVNKCIQLFINNQNEIDNNNQSDNQQQQQQIREFYFDRVFSKESNDEQVYMQSARKLVEFSFSGYNCTILLYGQTGTGKTHTHSRLTSNSFEHLFSLIQSRNQEARFLIRASYYELYNEEIRDLLSNKPEKSLELRESKARGVYIKDLTNFLVNNQMELEKLKQLGDKRRSTAATKMNEHSSRSHSIFSITIETVFLSSTSTSSVAVAVEKKRNKIKSNQQVEEIVRLGRLHLIDLAGSERQTKSESSGARLKEASRINLSLTCLSLVIRALTDKSCTHIPYRNSKLTRLLSSSLGGNSKTLLIACIAPEESNLDETLNTLRFASRTKRIKNKALINEDPKDALLRKYRKQVNELRRKLSEQQQKQQHHRQGSGSTFGDQFDNKTDVEITNDASKRQLEMLKAKLMIGGENLLDKMELHQRLLEASRCELEEKREREKKLREQLDEKRNRLEQVKESKGLLETQRQQLDSRLKRAILLYKRSKLEQKDLIREHEQLKESLLQGIKATSKEIKYVDCIIEDFIPREHLDLINAYAQYDDESDEWQIKYIAMSGNNIAQTSRRLTGAVHTSSSSGGGGSSSSNGVNAEFTNSTSSYVGLF